MTPKKKYINYIPYALLAILLGTGIYGFIHYNEIIDDLNAKLAKFDSNQAKMEGEFAKMNDEYNSMISNLSEKDQLLIESQQNLKTLNMEIQSIFLKSKITESDLADAKTLIAQLKTRLEYEGNIEVLEDDLEVLEGEIQVLEKKNNKSEAEIKRYAKLLKTKESLIKEIEGNLKKQEEIIRKGSSLRLVDFDIKGIKVRNNGKEVETDKASKADIMRVSFNINSNNISESGEKDIYIALYNSDNKLAYFPTAETGTITLQNGDLLEYTDHMQFYYEQGSNELVKFDWEKDDFESGDYNIKVFENGVMIGSETKSFR